ncbi:hypothetical protein LguiA_008905 [Lonicera macranthoides]
MSSTLVSEWIGEVTKLREKVRPFFLKPQRRSSEAASIEDDDDDENKASPVILKAQMESSKKEDTVMSELTVCLLMDRFVPW